VKGFPDRLYRRRLPELVSVLATSIVVSIIITVEIRLAVEHHSGTFRLYAFLLASISLLVTADAVVRTWRLSKRENRLREEAREALEHERVIAHTIQSSRSHLLEIEAPHSRERFPE
jgi:hypothetical protein